MIVKKEIVEKYSCKHCHRELDIEDYLIENECPYCGELQRTIEDKYKEKWK